MTAPTFLAVLAAVAQVALTLWAIVRMGLARVASVRSGETQVADIALSDRAWPEHIQKLQANTRNQFETPILFFAGLAIALAVGVAGWGVAVFAWAYVASRVVHRAIHVGSNAIGKRFRAYVLGLGALAGLWAALLLGIILP